MLASNSSSYYASPDHLVRGWSPDWLQSRDRLRDVRRSLKRDCARTVPRRATSALTRDLPNVAGDRGKRLARGLLPVGQARSETARSGDRLELAQASARSIGDEMMLDLEVEASEEEVEPAAVADVARSDHLLLEDRVPVARPERRHPDVVDPEEQGEMEPHDRGGHQVDEGDPSDVDAEGQRR